MERPQFDIRLDVLSQGFDGKTCWVQARAGAMPGQGANAVVLTMQPLRLTGSDVFHELNELRSDDGGRTWTGPTPHPETLGRRDLGDGVEVGVCDMNPRWHAASGRLLSTGHEVRYLNDNLAPKPFPRKPAYSVYDRDARAWAPWRTLELPDSDFFWSCGAGSAQRWDEEDGTILLPVYGFGRGGDVARTAVLRCAFDGERLAFVEHGDPMSVPEPRGLCEPSIARFQGRYYLTLRNDQTGRVTAGDDGLRFAPPRPWTFDDGSDLGNCNTQQHWIARHDALFLVYTRRAANNHHVFRHRAPLFVAQVDPDRLCVIRETERVLVPERGARLGNFQVVDVSEHETWVTVTEWMQGLAPFQSDWRRVAAHGADNRVYAARLVWRTPNEAIQPALRG